MGILDGVVDIKGLGERRTEYIEYIPIEVFDRYAFLVQSGRYGNIAVAKSPETPLENAVFEHPTMQPFERTREEFDNL